MTPTDDQAAAVKAIVAWVRGGRRTRQEFYLAGFAGVGKTTVVDIALAELRAKGLVRRAAIGAYTGKAANVLRLKGNPTAQTIHSMIYRPRKERDAEGDEEIVFDLNPAAPAADADLIVLDECSMVPEEMASDLRAFGRKILVMGDPGQLPTIGRGEGAFMAREPDVFLHEIHRQAAESPILRLATAARLGERLEVGDYGDGVTVQMNTRLTRHLVERPDTQTICGVNRVRWTITQRIRRARGFEGPSPADGETVVCGRNDHGLGLFNGGLGRVIGEPWDDDGLLRMSVRMDDREGDLHGLYVWPGLFAEHFSGPAEKRTPVRGIQHFDWGYALTCHKAQGSEWPDVTVVDDSAAFNRPGEPYGARWLYTAITRASKRLTVLLR